MNRPSDRTGFEQSPFPALRQIGAYSLESTDFFASWRNFRANGDACDGEMRIAVDLGHSRDSLPTASQKNAYLYLKENESMVTAAVLAGLYADYPRIREVYGGIEPEYLPEIERAADFCRLIEPLQIHINAESEDECAFIGFEFDCLWDEEHGLGVMMHRNKYIGCNDAEAAWNLDLARS